MSELVTVSPINGKVLVRRARASLADAENIGKKARKAQRDWAERPLSERVSTLEAAIQAVLARSEELALAITKQMGRPLIQTPGEIKGFAERGRYMLSVADEGLSTIDLPANNGLQRSIEREPIGVVLVIAPWNYPLLTAVNSIIPALAAGNAVVLKHSEQTPLCSELLVDTFIEAGVPAGVFQYIHATHDTIRALIQSPAIDYVAFTGSVRGGAAIEHASAGRFIGRGLELGGNDPAYVRKDADLALAAASLVDGAFFNSGQSCCGIQRIYVDQSHYSEFIDRAAALTEQYRLGDPLNPETNLGPMVRIEAADEIRNVISQSMLLGAREVVDTQKFKTAIPNSPYIAPSILIDVNHTMPIMSEECFGPVVGIMPVKSDEQAIELMNDSPYGLSAAVFTSDTEAAVQIGRQVQTGTFFMNRCDYLDPALAWTGVKNTGHGISLSVLGYYTLTRVKSYHLRTQQGI